MGRDRGHWRTALVTGASSGIGRAFAVALARKGTDLVVVARRRAELDLLAAELIGTHGRSVEVMEVDLVDPAQRGAVEARLADAGRPVDLLVNSAAIGTQGLFAAVPVDRQEREILLNVLALARLTRAALPGMIERGRGGVVNVSSLAGDQGLPMWANYAATKSYVTNFSRALQTELRGTGVKVLILRPGLTRTGFYEETGFTPDTVPGPAWMTAEAVAEGALRSLARGRRESVPGAHNRGLAIASRLSPWVLTREVLRVATRVRR